YRCMTPTKLPPGLPGRFKTMRFLQILVVTYFALLSLLPAYSQTVEYDGQQDLRPTFMGTAYEIEGGPHDGKRGYLFRIWNREGIPVQLTAIPGQFNQPVNSILGVSAQYSDGSYSFVGDTQPYRELFSGGTETLNPSPSGSIQDRPANFIAIVDPSVDTLVFSLNGRTATGSYAAAQIEPLVLAQDAGPNVAVSFKTDGLTYGEFLSAISQASSSTIDIVSDVFVDGIRVGDIPESGPLMLSLEPGAHAISGAIERLVGGRQSVDIVEGQTYNLTIDMTGEELASILDNRLVVNDSSAPVIDTATSEFRIDFETPGGGKFGLGDIFFVHAARIQPDLNFGGPPKQISKAEDITGHFQLDSNGRLYSPNPSGLIAALQSVGSGPYELMVSSSDVDQGLPLEGSIVIRLSQYALNGAVIRLPSSSAFPLDGIPVTAQSMTGGVSTTEITAADGSFSFGRLPEDTYKVSAETLFSSEVLAIEGVVSLNEPANLALTPLSLSQTVAGEQGFEIVSGASTATRLAPDTQARNLSTEKKRTNAIKSEWDRKGAPRGRPTGTIRKNSKFKLVAPASDEEAQTDGGTSRQ
ncbi:carboxypeptidase-like regulatory domain-containing protein, partial [Hyphomonas adhaerens]|uniref:carboxypeptidase-like regulatory domain-containing protein n=1 Tax=Hyphomonas adhaerens TaxID=81029 RepID=UPI0024811EE1